MELRSGCYDLIRAVREGRLEATRNYINIHGLHKSEAHGYVLLNDALKNGHLAVAELLLTRGARVNSKNQKQNPSQTALHFAVLHADTEIIKMILDRGANANAKDRDGKTPLHAAIECQKLEVTELLFKYGAHVNSDSNGYFLLHIAAQQGCLPTVENLLNHGASVNVLCTSRYRKHYTPLHFAVENGNNRVAVLLLSRGADVNAIADDNITPLHIASQKGYVSIAEDLINHNSNCVWIPTLKKGYLPLHFASELGNEEAVKFLLNRGADVNACAKDDLAPLHIAIKGGHKTVVRLLLKLGAKVDAQDKDRKTSLNLAVEKRSLDIVEDILKYGPDVDSKCNRNSLKTAVIEAMKNIMEALLKYGLPFNPEDANDPKLLHAAVEKGYLKIVEDLLITYHADVNAPQAYSGYTPLHSAAIRKLEQVATLLLCHKANVNAQDKDGRSPICHAIRNADLKFTKLLLVHGADFKSPEIFITAFLSKSIEIVRALLEHGVDIKAVDKHGRTALHFLVFTGEQGTFGTNIHEYSSFEGGTDIKVNMAKLLLCNGSDVDAQTENGMTTLHGACQNGYAEIVELLLENNANINCVGKGGITPLHLSAQRGDSIIVTILLKRGANVNATQENEDTALHLAAQNGRTLVAKILLESAAKVNCRNKSNLTPLLLSAEKGYHEIVEIVLKFGAHVNCRDDNGKTALHLASQNGHVKVVDILLKNGSDINVRSKDNYTALDYATEEKPRRKVVYSIRDDCYFHADQVIATLLRSHIVKLRTANLRVNIKNLRLLGSNDKIRDLEDNCKEELARMKIEKINKTNISTYDILTKNSSTLLKYVRNKNIVLFSKSDEYKSKFQIYAGMIENNFKKAMQRKKLLDENGDQICYILFNNFPELPYDCTEQIFNYLTDHDLNILIDACKL